MDKYCLTYCRWRNGMRGVSGVSGVSGASATVMVPASDDPWYSVTEAGRQAGRRSEHELFR